jgi:hypothetical protein
MKKPSARTNVPVTALGLSVLIFTVACNRDSPPGPARSSQPADADQEAEATLEQVQEFCGACHKYPPPDSFPRAAWKDQVKQAYDLFIDRDTIKHSPLPNDLKVPPKAQVRAYYEHRAPEALPLLTKEKPDRPMPVDFQPTALPEPFQLPRPTVSNVNLVHLSDPRKLDLLVCDMRYGRVMAMKPYEQPPSWRTLGRISHPAHAEVVDLDGDGIKDVIVANLGNYTSTDDKCGSVVWLRGDAGGNFTPITLLEGVGRVTDVQAADFRGNGKLDLVVAVFGWRRTGEVLYLENRTTDWAHPVFVPHVLDERTGAIHVPVADLNGDGRPDFVALISQEHETVVAFLNEGNGQFRKETIYTAPHPAYGSTGIQVVDLDGDGRLDVLYTNGDVFDEGKLKPYHGIHWLRNRGSYPFEHHLLTSMYGVFRAVAADYQGKGRLDIVAVSLLPGSGFPIRKEMNLDAVIYLEQTEPGKFVRHSLEMVTCDHATCAAGAWDGDGKIHFVTGNFCLFDKDSNPNSVTLWKNLGPRHALSH